MRPNDTAVSDRSTRGRDRRIALKEGGRSASDAPGRHRARNALVVAQVALAVVLMVVSGLMIRTFVAMRQVHPGFTHPEQVQTLLFGVGPMDPITFAAVSGTLAAVALLATYLPAHRASRVDPVIALRADV